MKKLRPYYNMIICIHYLNNILWAGKGKNTKNILPIFIYRNQLITNTFSRSSVEKKFGSIQSTDLFTNLDFYYNGTLVKIVAYLLKISSFYIQT